jgi:hypothetical protein
LGFFISFCSKIKQFKNIQYLASNLIKRYKPSCSCHVSGILSGINIYARRY